MASKTTKTIRTVIVAETVKQAIQLSKSAANSEDLQDWFDTKLRYLQLRQRGRSVKWYCRVKGKSILLGSAINELGSGYLSVAGARERATKVYVNGKPGSGLAVAPLDTPSWTWSELEGFYRASMEEIRETMSGREIFPSDDSQDDVRRSLAKPSIAKWRPVSINKLDPNMVEEAIAEIHANNGHRAASKSLAYVKAALNFATQMRRLSGISHANDWWNPIFPPKRTEEERNQAKADKKRLTDNKTYYSVDHLGELLVAHEEYCASREGLSRISPGIRWGIWWVAFTANRRRTPTVLRRSELLFEDAIGRPGWGIAKWEESEMKGQTEFWLPLPPVVLHVAVSSIEEWEGIVNRSASTHKATTAWVFASTRRVGRDPNTVDVAVNGSSLSHHIEDLRAWDEFPKQIARRDDGTFTDVSFTLHIARSIVGNWLDNHDQMPASASSLILAHAGKKDAGTDDVAKTTKRFYLTGQKMMQKAIAMEAWSDAIMNAYVKAGGAPPMPRNHEFKRRRPSPNGQITKFSL